jgi:hypothetical protein
MTDHQSNDITMKTPTLSFPTKFTLHLAASLVGPARLNECYSSWNHTKQYDRQIYWRTPLNMKGNVRFVDITIVPEIAKDNDDTSRSVSSNHPLQLFAYVGLLRSDTADTADPQAHSYVRGRMEEPALKTHWKELGIDLETTAPRALAMSMAKALRRGLQADVSSTKLVLPLYYEDVDQSLGCIEVPIESQCVLDVPTVTMLLSNLEHHVKVAVPSAELPVDDYDTDQVENAFLHCLVEKPTTPTQEIITEAINKPVRPRTRGTVRSVPTTTRRKKAKTLSYSKG